VSILDITPDGATARDTPRTYGGYRPPATPGLFGLGSIGTALLVFAALIVFVVWQTAGLLPGLTTFTGAALLLAALLVKDRDRRNLLTRGTERLAGLRARRRRFHRYRSGPLSVHEWGTHALPGLLGATELWQAGDSIGRKTAVLRWTATGDTTLILRAEPDGLSLVDEDQVDRWVAAYGAWLASLADEPGLLGATVIVESAPDTGVRLRATVAAKADPRGHPVSLAVLRESADTFATGTPQSTVWVTLTYETPGAKTGLTGPAEELVDRITGLAAGLAGTGVDDARPATAQELCEEMLVAYDPARQADIDAARVAAADDTTPILALSWEDVGPVTATAHRSYYQHDSGASMTWEMSEAPRGVHYANILAALVAPQRGLRKRVALHYQVVPPWEAATQVQKDVRTTEFRASQSKRPSARVTTEVRAAHQTAAEESAGAALLTVGLTLTATATDTVEGLHGLPVPATHQLPAVRTAVGNASATARIRLRLSYEAQDSAFLSTCPVGVIYPRHLHTPTGLREGMR
jgi:hypothetical protein